MSRFYDAWGTGLTSEREAGGGALAVGVHVTWDRWELDQGLGLQVRSREPRKSRCMVNSCRHAVEPRGESSKRALPYSCPLPSRVCKVTLSDAASFKRAPHLNSFRQVRGRVRGSS